jgi:hypothetical protein
MRAGREPGTPRPVSWKPIHTARGRGPRFRHTAGPGHKRPRHPAHTSAGMRPRSTAGRWDRRSSRHREASTPCGRSRPPLRGCSWWRSTAGLRHRAAARSSRHGRPYSAPRRCPGPRTPGPRDNLPPCRKVGRTAHPDLRGKRTPWGSSRARPTGRDGRRSPSRRSARARKASFQIPRRREAGLPLFPLAHEDTPAHQGPIIRCPQRPAGETLLALQVRHAVAANADSFSSRGEVQACERGIAVLLTVTGAAIGQERASLVRVEDGGDPRAARSEGKYRMLVQPGSAVVEQKR